jgi:uncharacterized membrane protein YdbT with pleckstrin-like domain
MDLPSPWENVSDADWIHLTDDEVVRWTGRPSRVTIAPAVLGGLAVALAGITLWIEPGPTVTAGGLPAWVGDLPLVLVAAGLALSLLVYLDWLRLLYVITDEEVYVKEGLVSRDVTQVRLDRVQNTAFEQSVRQRVLGYGDVRLYTAGTNTEDITFERVPGPEQVSQLVTELLSERAESSGQHRSTP